MYSSLTGTLSPNLAKVWITAIAIAATVLTASYALQTFRRIFFGQIKENLKPKEAPLQMLIPIIILAALSIILGIYPTLITSELGALLAKLLMAP